MKKRLVSFVLVFLIISVTLGYSSDALLSKIDMPKVGVEKDSERVSSEGLTRYVYGAGLVASVKDSEINYYHSDRIQSNRLVTDSSGSVEKEFKSLPFGQEISNSGVKYAFATGKELDESDLYYFGARYYDSNIGRFSSVDSIAGEPSYSYVRNNPLNLVDPDGNEASAYYGVGMDPNQIYGSRQCTPAWGFRGERNLFGAEVGIGLDFMVSGNDQVISWIHPIYASYNLDLSIPVPFGFNFNIEHSSEHSQSDLLGETADIELIGPSFNIENAGASTDLWSFGKGNYDVGLASTSRLGNTNTLLDINGPITLVSPTPEKVGGSGSGVFTRYKNEGKYGEFSVMGIFDFYNGYVRKGHFGAAGYTTPEFSLDRLEEGLSIEGSIVGNTERNWQVSGQVNFEF